MQHSHAVSAICEGVFEETRLSSWARGLRGQLSAPRVTLGVVFMTPGLFDDAAQVLEVLRLHAQVPLLVGCSAVSLIAGDREREDIQGVALGLYHLPGAQLQALHFRQAQVEEANGPAYWHVETGVGSDQTSGWLVFADPFHLDSETWLNQWNGAYAGLPIMGGLASGDFQQQRTQVYLNGEVFEEGGVALAVGGEVQLTGVISQGCTPIGETWTITQAERNLIHTIGNRPAYEVLLETFNNLPAAEQAKTRGNLLVGMVVNEYLEDFQRGDFLIRNLLGADPKSGAIAVGAMPRTGQTIQFQRRDAEAATEDMGRLLDRARAQLAGRELLGACLCCCSGRGQRMFGSESHDSAMVHRRLGPPGLTGFFCSGEIGPVGERNFLHGFTASLALFVQAPPAP
jgi:small ligand-binding sensory domain FIST